MELEKQVASLEQAKRLAELGIEQKGLFTHLFFDNTRMPVWQLRLKPCSELSQFNTKYSAFTVAELGEMLPDGQELDKEDVRFSPCYNFRSYIHEVTEEKYHCEYIDIEKSTLGERKIIYHGSGLTQAQAMAKLLIHLLENNLVTPEDCNKRLSQ